MILIIIMIQSLKELPSNLNMVCSSRIQLQIRLVDYTSQYFFFSNMKTLSFFLVHVQRLWKWNDFQKSYLTNFKKSENDSAAFLCMFFFILYANICTVFIPNLMDYRRTNHSIWEVYSWKPFLDMFSILQDFYWISISG